MNETENSISLLDTPVQIHTISARDVDSPLGCRTPTPGKWLNSPSEFKFQDMGTPSDGRAQEVTQKLRLHKVRKLQNRGVPSKKSRLDLYDDQLTSFPEPPRMPNEVNHEPLVVVEDYIEGRGTRKRVSVANLRLRMAKSEICLRPKRGPGSASLGFRLGPTPDLGSPKQKKLSSTMLAARAVDDEINFRKVSGASSTSTAVSTVSSKISSQDTLTDRCKNCVICDKPLYGVAQFLSSEKELVCGDCTTRYEETARILDDYEFDTTDSSIETSSFSPTLIGKLQSQLATPVDSRTMMWFIDAKNKLRWRWRVSGLVPRFMQRS